MVQMFINRPVLSIVISLIISLLGGLAMTQLPVTQYPDIAPPAVTVTTKYTGANAGTCTKAVVTPIERALNGVPGMTYMTSVSGNDGTSIIQVYFQVGTDPDLAAVNVQNRVSSVLDELPEEVIKAGVLTEKEVNSMLLYLNLVCSDSTIDEKFVFNFADINILPELKRIDGVGFVDIMGQREYSMRVWLKPDQMTVYGVSAEDVIQSLRDQNVEAAPGKVGESSGTNTPQSLQYVLRYTGKFTEKEQFENIVLKASSDGDILHLKDIATIEFGSLDYDVISMENGKPSAAIIIKQRPGSNASEVIENIKGKMIELKSSTFPSNIDYTISYDVSRFLDASIHEVIRTLVEAFFLVSIVVFIFLQDFRSTLIPALAVPVSLIGTFFFMQLFGFSINLLTLFALVLAIGIVIDNAIVVVEAVHAKMEKNHCDARTATISAMGEISGAIIAITLVMSAVFVPVAFMSGPTGVFYRQFSITLAISIVISGINALTLTPALCAIMLKNNHSHPKKKNWLNNFFHKFNFKYNQLAGRYKSLLELVANRRTVTFGVLAFFIIATWGTNLFLPSAFIPIEDQGTIYASITTPSGATLERTQKVVAEIQQISANIPAVESVSTLSGYSLMTEGSGASFGMAMVGLKPWEQRDQSVDEIITLLTEKTKTIKDASIQFFPPPAVPGYGNAGGFEFRIQDRTSSNDLKQIEKVTSDFLKVLNDRPEIDNAFTSFDASFPQYLIQVDNEKAAQKGVTIDNAMNNLQALIGSYYATNFIRYGQMYKVMVQAAPKYRAQPDDLLKLYVKNNKGDMVPYSAFTTIKRVFGPEQLTRYNMFTSAMVNGDAALGYSSGDAIKAIEEVAQNNLPKGYTYEWSGMTRDEILSGNQVVYIFIICLVFVYLLLAAQYESFLLPLPVILSLPTGIFGSYFLLLILGLENNIYAQVALVMLIGLLGKNAILIVEFAIQKQKEGATPFRAAIEGATDRLRPILMTSFAFIAGLIPLMIASGAGAIGNQTIGTAAAGGMLFGTLFGLVLIPGLYVFFASISADGNYSIKRNRTIIKIRRMIKPKKIRVVAATLILFIVVSGCKTQQTTIEKTDFETLPNNFSNLSSDSTNVADINWKNYFEDSALVSLIEEGLASNLDLLTTYQKIEIYQSNVLFSKGMLFPNLDLYGSVGQRRFGKYTVDGVGNFDTQFSPNITEDQIIPEHLPDYSVGLQTTWEVDVRGKLRNKKKAAFANYLASIEGKNWIITNLISEISMAYYELLALDYELDIIKETSILQKQALDIVSIQKEAGKANELAVQQFEAQYLNSKGLEVEFLQLVVETENKLNFLLGRFPGPIYRNKNSFDNDISNKVGTGLPSDLLKNRPDIRQAEQELIASKADLKAAKAAFYPALTINAGLGYQTFNTNYFVNPESFIYNIVGGLTMPLLNRSAIQADFKASKASQIQAMYNYQKAILNGYIEVYNQLAKLDNYTKFYDLKNQEVTVLNKSIETSFDLFSTGRASYFEIILSQKNALNSRINLIEVRKNQYFAIINIYKSLGGGWN